jgi:hypothetical protein
MLTKDIIKERQWGRKIEWTVHNTIENRSARNINWEKTIETFVEMKVRKI